MYYLYYKKLHLRRKIPVSRNLCVETTSGFHNSTSSRTDDTPPW